MENRLKRIEILLVFVALLSLANLLTPMISSMMESSEETLAEEKKELPPDVNRESCNKIVYEIKNNFNQADWEGMYNIFGDFAQAEFTAEKNRNGVQSAKSRYWKN